MKNPNQAREPKPMIVNGELTIPQKPCKLCGATMEIYARYDNGQLVSRGYQCEEDNYFEEIDFL